MTVQNEDKAPITIFFRDAAGENRKLQITSDDPSFEVRRLADRLVKAASNLPVTMEELLTEIDVPAEHRDECAAIINDELHDLAIDMGLPEAADYRDEPIPRDLFREFSFRVPDSFVGSYLERWIMARHTFWDEEHGLRYLAEMMKLIAESFGTSPEDSIEPNEAKSVLLNIAGEVLQAAYIYEPEGAADEESRGEQPQRAVPEPMSA